MIQYRYKAFISYAHSDERWARWLQRSLERYRPPTAVSADRLAPIFRDREDLAAASDLSSSIVSALEDSEALIVVCSPAAVASGWVAQEIQTYIDLGRRDHVHCLVVDGDPSGDDALPELLRSESGHEPMAADLRPGKDGRQLALLKLAAALLGVELDSLRQRELRRRNQRLVAIAAAATVGMVVTSGLALAAVFAREEAEVARQETEIRQKQAETLVGFMLGDLRTKLESVGRLDVMRDVGAAATDYFAAVPAELMSDEELLQRALSIRQLGTDRASEGDLDLAFEMFQEARRMDAALVDRAPTDAERGLALADDHYWIGVVHYQRDELTAALDSFFSQRDAVARVADAHPHDVEIRTNLAYVRNNVGLILRQQGELDAALDSLSASREVLQALAADTGDRFLLRDAVDVSVAVADLEWRIGDLRRAEEILTEAVAVAGRLQARYPGDVGPYEALGLAHSYMGRVLYAQGNARAVEHVGAELMAAERRHQIALDAPDARRAVAMARLRSGAFAARFASSYPELEVLASAHRTLEELALLDESDVSRVRDLADGRYFYAQVLAAEGESERALALVESAQARLSSASDASSFETQRLLATGYALSARYLFAAGQLAEAVEAKRRLLASLDAIDSENDARVIELRALALVGSDPAAGTLIESLESRGWALDVRDIGGSAAARN